ncbi:SLC13/DASS family transporter (plasmid) [Paracoccus pantotrophus]|uniref:SLC13/DASS family transporter n=2 Tax=Paracoccaceae TaxID=31989 RepID=A0A7H9C1X1_PARPN|nr:SLC13 family permease [Paracoccus pantotrophus]QLH16998.1 SLC13/DASS family transporter [Paracoccus pantotrophus]SFO60554.1 anion transporter [Paracoccus pantotrophus]
MSPTTITLLLLLFAIVMFVWERIPLAVTAMIVCLGLALTGVLEPKEAFAGFVNNNVILFVGMFVIGGALFQTGMASEIGGLVTRFAKTERQLVVAIMMITGLMSGVLSNTGTAAVLIPVVIGIAAKSGFARSRLLMPIVFAAAMGGNLSLIGAPGNMIAQAALESIDLRFGFFEYGYVGLPMLLAGTLFMATVGYRLLPDHKADEAHDTHLQEARNSVPQWKKTASLIILVCTVLGMVFEKQIGIPLHITSVIGALALILTGVISEKQAYGSIDAQTIVLFGGILSLATAMETTGAGTAVAQAVLNLMGPDTPMFVIMLVIFLLAVALTNFMSNTATTALLVPIGMSISTTIGADPRAVLMAIVIGGSLAYATPIGMPANVMVLGPGGYTFKDYARAGLPLILVSTIVSMVLLPILFPFFP